MDFGQFENDIKTIDAVVRNLEIIGEATRQLPDEFKDRNAQIAWHQIVGIRNRIIHEYFGVDLQIIWKVIKDDLNALEKGLNHLK